MAPSERGLALIEIISVLVGLATIAVALRILARIKKVGFGIDDYLSFISLLLLYSMFIELVLWCTIGGNGKHLAELTPNELLEFGKIFIANQFSYFLLSPTIKISIICFYRRIFSTQTFHLVTLALNCLIAAWGTGIFLTSALQCRPLRAFWDHSIDGHCLNGNSLFVVNQAFSIVMDFVILGLPLPMIWGLHRSWQDKLALTGIFAVGGFICFASIFRIVTLGFIDDQDQPFTIYQATLWTHVEPSIGIVCSCLPIIRGLFSVPKSGKRSQRSQNRQNNSSERSQNSIYLDDFNLKKLDYVKMTNSIAYEDEERSVGAHERLPPMPKEIMVQTDINVTHGDRSL